jgi:hypothetical protein
MSLWTFLDYLGASGENMIVAWLQEIHSAKTRTKVSARMDAKIEHVSVLEQRDWPRYLFTELAGFPGILEMRFTYNNVQYRPLGFFGPDRYEFTFLIGAIEKNSRFIPPNAPDTALARKDIVESDKGRTSEHE